MILTKSYNGIHIIVAAILLTATVLPGPVSAQVRGVSYSLSPTGSAMSWNKQSGLDGGYMYGGQLGFGFGRFVELSGLYMISTGVETNIGRIDFLNDIRSAGAVDYAEKFQRRDVDIARYGGNLSFNIGSGMLIPYIAAGTGIIEIDPENRPKSEHIYLSGGAGIKYSIDSRFTLNVGVDNIWYRYNPAATFLNETDLGELGIVRSTVRDEEVGNWALTASVTGYLGGRDPMHMSDLDQDLQKQFSGGFKGISIIVEPTVGVIQFNDKLPFRADQRVAGGSAGFDFGPYVGLRGFYLRGLKEDEWTKFDQFAMYGGEMKFRLNDAPTGLVPYLSLGAGYIDVNNEYEGRRIANDKPFALGGGGVEMKLNDNFKLFGSAKAVLVSSDDLTDLNSTESVTNSWMFNGGLSFALGSKQKNDIVRREVDGIRDNQEAFVKDPEILDLSDQIEKESTKSETTTSTPPKFITIPVLEDGEIYIRFGKTSSMKVVTNEENHGVEKENVNMGKSALHTMDIEQLRMMIQSILRETLRENGIISAGSRSARTDTVIIERLIERVVDQTAATQQERVAEQRKQTNQGTQDTGRSELQITGGGSETQKVDEKAIEERILNRIQRRHNDTLVTSLQKQIAELQEQLDKQSDTTLGTQSAVDSNAGDEGTSASRDPNTIERLNLEGLSATAGFNLAGKPFQFVLGVRADYGDVLGGRFRLAPDANIGFINTMSYNVNVNMLANIRVDDLAPWRPYTGFGLGLLGYNEPPDGVKGVQGTFNLLVGAEKPMGDSNAIFVEYMNMNLFKFNRLQAGYRFAFK